MRQVISDEFQLKFKKGNFQSAAHKLQIFIVIIRKALADLEFC
jgi:hypothetical protein